MKKVIFTLLFATVAGALTFGAAAGLQVDSENLGSGGAGVVSCDPDGVDVSYNLAKGNPQVVDGFTVSGIHEQCIGQLLSYSVLDDKGEALVAGNRAITTASESFSSFTLQVADIAEVAITLAG
jgi:hypothetical protein